MRLHLFLEIPRTPREVNLTLIDLLYTFIDVHTYIQESKLANDQSNTGSSSMKEKVMQKFKFYYMLLPVFADLEKVKSACYDGNNKKRVSEHEDEAYYDPNKRHKSENESLSNAELGVMCDRIARECFRDEMDDEDSISSSESKK